LDRARRKASIGGHKAVSAFRDLPWPSQPEGCSQLGEGESDIKTSRNEPKKLFGINKSAFRRRETSGDGAVRLIVAEPAR